jgi:autotransporter-associated beta strand protein
MRGQRAVLGAILVMVATVRPASAQIAIERITTGPTGFSAPIFGTSPPGDPSKLYVVQQGGQVRSIDTRSPAATPQPFLTLNNTNFPNTNLTTGGEQGLLGMAFHPGYESNGLFYAFYTANSGNELRVDQFIAPGGVVQNGTRKTVISIPHPTHSNHNGGWIGFSPTGGSVLSIATGDGGGSNDPGNHGQNTNSLLGKMLRIDVGPNGLVFGDPASTYTIPQGNMTVNPNGNLFSPAPPSLLVRPEIYAYGLRNPWRNSFDRLTGDLYIADVGQNAREEISFIPAGRMNSPTLDQSPGSLNGINFGWRLREGTLATPTVGSSQLRNDNVQPIFDYVRSGTSGQLPFYGRSVTGGYVYRGPAFHDHGIDLSGSYLFADYVSQQIGSFRYDAESGTLADVRNRTNEMRTTLPAGASLTNLASFAEDGHGNVYLLNAGSGDIFRLVPALPDGPRIDVPAGTSLTQAQAGYPRISGDFTLGKFGAGRVVLDVPNTHTGVTTIAGGTLALAVAEGAATSIRIDVATGATFDLRGLPAAYDVPSGQSIAGSGTVTGAVVFGAGATLAPGAVGGSGGTLAAVAVPEPATLALTLAAALWAALGRWFPRVKPVRHVRTVL